MFSGNNFMKLQKPISSYQEFDSETSIHSYLSLLDFSSILKYSRYNLRIVFSKALPKMVRNVIEKKEKMYEWACHSVK